LRLKVKLKLPPTSNHRLIPVNGRLITSPKMRAWKKYAEEAVTISIMGHLGDTPMTGNLSVTIIIGWPDYRKRDIDGPVKPVLDALTKGGMIKDDSLIKDLWVKVDENISKVTAGVSVEVESVE
tara:strand:- start:52 stop:423 length:372 start_codon:yes stop_codon:yes gene_type:complete